MTNKKLELRNLHENNLKNIDLDIPHDRLVTISGLSGSGKSSLAFDTVYAEGQRRYIETFSPYTRQFLDKVKKPNADQINNVRPAIAIQQRTRVLNSRSTVGSLTNLNDYLRILWMNLATPVCETCGITLFSYSPRELTDVAKNLVNNFKDEVFYLGALISWQKGKLKELQLAGLHSQGFSRYWNDEHKKAELIEPEAMPPIWSENSSILILDRFSSKNFKPNELTESINTSYRIASGSCLILKASNLEKKNSFKIHNHNNQNEDYKHRVIESSQYFEKPTCSSKTLNIPKARPALFSYNHPYGACETCNGFGFTLDIDPKLCVPNPALSIEEKAIHCWSSENRTFEFNKLIKFCTEQKIPTYLAWQKLSEKHKKLIFETKSKTFTGVYHFFKRLERKIYKMHVRVFLSRYRSQNICHSCEGKRLKPTALMYKIAGLSLPDLWNMELSDLKTWLNQQKESLQNNNALPSALADVFLDVETRINFLLDLGLSYISLNRTARTLSNGETQRVNLASALGNNLVSTHFVLDEPSVGLHPRDSERLIKSVKNLKNRGNSVLVVEHDPEFILSSDEVIEIGPKAGSAGGNIIYNGVTKNWKNASKLLNSVILNERNEKFSKFLHFKNLNARNLKNISFKIPLNTLTCISGVSGSGKSSIIKETLLPCYESWKNLKISKIPQGEILGFKDISDCTAIDQTPLSKTPRANIATYTGIWDFIRKELGDTELSQSQGFSASSFSFNVDGGRCSECKGAGYIKEDMQFLSDVYLPCEVCQGKRFKPQVLEVTWQGKNVLDWLNTTVNEISNILEEHKKIKDTTELLKLLGLEHLTLGHALSELSGGEAQRLKLVPFLTEKNTKNTLFIFDEPTSGLHVEDVKRLLELFDILKEKGHSIICIEHNLQVLAHSDFLIDLGKEGGKFGGELVFEGRPIDLLKIKDSHTAQFLKLALNSKEVKVSKEESKINNAREIIIKGATEHNLKGVDLNLPLETIIAFTGVSGSGKTSIAKDILFAEGQRRYLDCLSPYARQFIKGLKKPAVQKLENIPPSIYIGQHTHLPSKLSTVGTLSEVYNYLRLLFAKLGEQYCPDHPKEKISSLTAETIVSEISNKLSGRIKILAPIINKKKGHHREVISRAIGLEFPEVRVDGMIVKTISVVDGLERNKVHSIEYVIANCNLETTPKDLLVEAVNQALHLGQGSIIVLNDKKELIFSTERACPKCKRGFLKLDPEDFSFSSKRGACQNCEGLGILENEKICPKCEGTRLNKQARNVRIQGKNIFEIINNKPSEILNFINSLDQDNQRLLAIKNVLTETVTRLKFLEELGINHLSLNRSCQTLSSGELQRVRLASALGSPLSGVLYLLDEPSASLHPKDNQLVLKELHKLVEQNNTVVIIEHDPDTILIANHIVELGPGGGSTGGNLIFNGTKEKFLKSNSITANILKNTNQKIEGANSSVEFLKVSGRKNNVVVKNLKVPLGELVTIAGLSGAGKSSLVHGIIFDGITEGKKTKDNTYETNFSEIKSTTEINNILNIDQSPLGKTSRSTPASFLKIWDEIRGLLAKTIEARSFGWNSSYFSFNSGRGRCPQCEGRGELILEMNFLANASVPCDFCNGQRFSDEANLITYQGYNPSQLLGLTFEQANIVFNNYPKIKRAVRRACELGLGYLTLGQSSSTLSGGEAQRLKIVKELSARSTNHNIYIFDEPTTGLHESDVGKLVKIFRELINLGNSVIVIEHNPSIILSSDYVIELGPGPGELGGKIIFEGSPDELKRAKTPWGEYFRE